jgi:glutathione S-transferase
MKQPLPTITAFKASPDRGRGHARDFRVRWAFEEVGQPYNVQLVTFDEMKQPAYRALQPFGQIPAYQEGELVLFETGAIVLHIAENHPGLLPEDGNARTRAIAWIFAAINSVEPVIAEREGFILLEKEKRYYQERLPMLNQRVSGRLQELSTRLGTAEWLDGDFSAGDLMMVTVLRRPAAAGQLESFPNLRAYVARAEARPAFQRAFAAQLAVYEASLKSSPR